MSTIETKERKVIMKIAPIDIAHKSFSRKMMGLDPEEVTAFLKSVSAELEALISERNSLRQSSREKDLSIIEFKERDELLKSTITTATKMSDKIRIDSERESRLLLNDANQKAEAIVRDARDSLKLIYQEITDLKKIRMQFENNMKALVGSHLTMIEQGQNVMPSPKIGHEVVRPKRTANPSAVLTSLSDEDQIKSNISQALSKATQINLDLK